MCQSVAATPTKLTDEQKLRWIDSNYGCEYAQEAARLLESGEGDGLPVLQLLQEAEQRVLSTQAGIPWDAFDAQRVGPSLQECDENG